MKKKLIAFDLDGTLAASKSALSESMAAVLQELLNKYEVCVISGGKFEQFESQLLQNLDVKPSALSKLHLMPTCGTRYYKFNAKKLVWGIVYAEDFSISQKSKIIHALNQGIDSLGYREKQTWGETIEDRGSQITFSALGQDIVAELGQEGVRLKEQWDPTSEKKRKLRDYVAKLIPEFEVGVGGGTSIDITKPGVDKAYGMNKILIALNITKPEILFIGDRLELGGNDYPVKAMGIESIDISTWQETEFVIRGILAVS